MEDKTIKAIESELAYQKALVAEKDYNKVAPVSAEILMMSEYMDQCKKDFVFNTGDEKALHTIRKITAMGVRTMNNHGAPPRPKKVKFIMEKERQYLNPKDVQMVIYHKGCQDGLAAAACACISPYNGTDYLPNFVPMSYGDVKTFLAKPDIIEILKGKNILFVDFSFKRKDLEYLKTLANKVMVLDHHKSAMEDLKDVEGCFFDMEESGASMAWNYFFPGEPLPLYIKYVKDRDLWAWKLRENSEPFYYGVVDIKGKTELPFAYTLYFRDSEVLLAVEHGKHIMAKNREIIQERVIEARTRHVRIDGNEYKIMILEVDSFFLISETAEYMYTHNDVCFTVIWKHKPEKGEYILSFRTNQDEIDVSKIAVYYGGGGHAKASGATIDHHPDEEFREDDRLHEKVIALEKDNLGLRIERNQWLQELKKTGDENRYLKKELEKEEDIVIRSTDKSKHPKLHDAVKKEMLNHDYYLDEWDFEAKLSSDKNVHVTIYKKTSDFEKGFEWDEFEFTFSGR